ncbi:MAG: hypothetical protein H5T99_00710, partial [Moorella sp. (in: Bacteria)]|nr:hypothetical protein [Moorella sp. (in: firmicutes)]
MKKALAALLAAFFLVSVFVIPVQAGELKDWLLSLGDQIVDQANQDTNNHYVEKNEAGEERRLHEVYRGQCQGIIFNALDELDLPLLVLTWGDPHGDQKGDHKRYIGYTRKNEDFTNPAFPHDAWAGGYLEDRNWISQPWNDKRLGQQYNDFDENIDRDSISLGLQLQYGDVLAGPDARPDFWNNLLEYLHVLAPPTTYTWGMGRMWHRDANGNVWYLSVPLVPKIMENAGYVKYPD